MNKSRVYFVLFCFLFCFVFLFVFFGGGCFFYCFWIVEFWFVSDFLNGRWPKVLIGKRLSKFTENFHSKKSKAVCFLGFLVLFFCSCFCFFVCLLLFFKKKEKRKTDIEIIESQIYTFTQTMFKCHHKSYYMCVDGKILFS